MFTKNDILLYLRCKIIIQVCKFVIKEAENYNNFLDVIGFKRQTTEYKEEKMKQIIGNVVVFLFLISLTISAKAGEESLSSYVCTNIDKESRIKLDANIALIQMNNTVNFNFLIKAHYMPFVFNLEINDANDETQVFSNIQSKSGKRTVISNAIIYFDQGKLRYVTVESVGADIDETTFACKLNK